MDLERTRHGGLDRKLVRVNCRSRALTQSLRKGECGAGGFIKGLTCNECNWSMVAFVAWGRLTSGIRAWRSAKTGRVRREVTKHIGRLEGLYSSVLAREARRQQLHSNLRVMVNCTQRDFILLPQVDLNTWRVVHLWQPEYAFLVWGVRWRRAKTLKNPCSLPSAS